MEHLPGEQRGNSLYPTALWEMSYMSPQYNTIVYLTISSIRLSI